MRDQLIALPPKMPIIAGCAAAPRSLVEEIIEQLIASLDSADGDPDLDACEAGDDRGTKDAKPIGKIGFDNGGGFDCEDAEDGYDREMTNEDGQDTTSPILPRYAIDQSQGPTNQRQVLDAHFRSMREGGR